MLEKAFLLYYLLKKMLIIIRFFTCITAFQRVCNKIIGGITFDIWKLQYDLGPMKRAI